jgi:hypothetical protein
MLLIAIDREDGGTQFTGIIWPEGYWFLEHFGRKLGRRFAGGRPAVSAFVAEFVGKNN